MLTVSLTALLIAGTPDASDCAYDRAAMMSLDQNAFDQDEHGGWRKVSARTGCETAAADLIADYRDAHHRSSSTTLWMHEAQMRASAGDYSRAKVLFGRSKHTMDGFGWNDYIDATVAFLDRDKTALRAARDRLASTPRPETHPWFDPDGKPIDAPQLPPGDQWPYNLAVVDALIHCFSDTYKIAYSSPSCYSKKSKR